MSQGLIPNPLTPNLPTTQHCLANFWGGQSQALPFRVRKFKFRRSKTTSGSSSFLSICCLITLTTIFFRGRFVCKDVPEGPSFGITFQALQTGLDWSIHNLHRFLLKQLFNWMRYRQREGFLYSHRRYRLKRRWNSHDHGKLTVADFIFSKSHSSVSSPTCFPRTLPLTQEVGSVSPPLDSGQVFECSHQ